MDRMTAYRTFGQPGYTPVKHVKIFNDRWYRCRFQNVETDPRSDYVGLGEGEYVEILPGQKARTARDARLNHLNGLEEWTGPVFKVERPQWNDSKYVGSAEEANALKAKWQADNAKSMAEAMDAIAKEAARSDEEIIQIYGQCQGWPGHEQERVAERRQELEESRGRNATHWAEAPVITEVKSVPVWNHGSGLSYPPPRPVKHVKRAAPRLSR